MRESKDGGLVVAEEEQHEWSKASELGREDNCARERGGVRGVGVAEGGAYIQQIVLEDESPETYSSELL